MRDGTISGGPAAEFIPALLPSGGAASRGAGLDAERSVLKISGGVIRPGRASLRGSERLGPPRSAVICDSTFDISGGDFSAGVVTVIRSSGSITGGRFDRIEQFTNTCVEIRGGSFRALESGGTLILFGHQFSLDFGPMPDTGGNVPVAVTGILADGSPLDVELTFFAPNDVRLARPSDPGCL